MNPGETISLMLLKSGRRSHIEDLRAGLLHMNPLPYFAQREGADEHWHDPFEATSHVFQPEDVASFRVNGEEIQFVGPVRMNDGQEAPPNVLCLFGLTEPLGTPLVDPRNAAFGDSFTVILDTEEFIRRVLDAAANLGFGGRFDRVEYYDENSYSGETGPFRKPSRFSHQREWRFALNPGLCGPLCLDVGNLTEITSQILPTDAIETLRLEPADTLRSSL